MPPTTTLLHKTKNVLSRETDWSSRRFLLRIISPAARFQEDNTRFSGSSPGDYVTPRGQMSLRPWDRYGLWRRL